VWYLLYNLLLTIGFVAALPFLPLVPLLGPRYRDGLSQRFGVYPKQLVAGLAAAKPVWIHAASVGEVRAAGALVRAFKTATPGRKVLISTFTATGHHLARQMDGVDAAIFLPLDFHWIARGVLARIDPSLLVFIETEIWPNLLREAYRRGVPTLLLSGRISAKAFSRYFLWRGFFHEVLGYFTFFGMQSTEDAARIQKLGGDENKITVSGNLKFASERVGGHWQSIVSARDPRRQLLVAGSSHRGEEEILLQVLTLTRERVPALTLVLAPRHPERFAEVEKLLQKSPFAFHRKSQVQADRYFEKDILLLDTVGELPDFFAAADVAFVGGSLVNVGGHNVLEPARFQKPVLFGPHMSNFESIAEEMKQIGAAIEVQDADDLARVLVRLLTDEDARTQMGRRAFQFAGANHDACTRNFSLAQRYLPPYGSKSYRHVLNDDDSVGA
jgi:3-deoxy-D-manno-octulosonic-acid transferase